MAIIDSRLEVTLVTTDGATTKRVRADVNALLSAANEAQARWIIVSEDHDRARDLPIWVAFDVYKFGNMMGQAVLPIPTRSFTSDTNDAAVMWAVHQGRKR